MNLSQKLHAGSTVDKEAAEQRLRILDGWRATSIIFVLAGHWFPLGPKALRLNEAIAATGMATFFCLSGFLIVKLLIHDTRVIPFVLRRLFRIVPLAWSAMLLLYISGAGSTDILIPNLLFVANNPPTRLFAGGEHLWSLCVEVQFYAVIALIVAIAGRRGLFALPALAIIVTALRVTESQTISIVTWHRLDEILVGGCLALLVYKADVLRHGQRLPTWLPIVLLIATVASASPLSGAFAYLRPYLTMATLGVSLVAMPRSVHHLFTSRAVGYVAKTSYAVYVVHGVLTHTWLGSGDLVERYAKRPLLVFTTFFAAHLSTKYFEEPLIKVGKSFAARFHTR